MYEKGKLIVTIYASQPILVNIGNFHPETSALGAIWCAGDIKSQFLELSSIWSFCWWFCFQLRHVSTEQMNRAWHHSANYRIQKMKLCETGILCEAKAVSEEETDSTAWLFLELETVGWHY